RVSSRAAANCGSSSSSRVSEPMSPARIAAAARFNGSSRIAAVAITLLGLFWRTRQRSVGTEYATITRQRFQQLCATAALVKVHASVLWHDLDRLMPAVGTGQSRFQNAH